MATMLIALLKGKLIDAAYAERRRDYLCPACKQSVGLRHGRQVQPYFAHRAKEACTVFSEGETQEHLTGKRQLMAFFAPWGPITLEKILPEIQQRADCWVERTGKQPAALEFQCSPITTEQVTWRTDGYREISAYPFWILGSRYGRQKLGWSLIERFATKLKGWGLCLLFWDVARQELRVDHHLAQDSLGVYVSKTTWVKTLAEFVAGSHVLPQVTLDYWGWRERLARDLRQKQSGVLDIQEVLYLAGHHVLSLPKFLHTKATTLPLFGRGLLLWRAVLVTKLFALPTDFITTRVMNDLAGESFTIVGGHPEAVWFTAESVLPLAQANLLALLTTEGYLEAVTGGWRVCHQPKWHIN